jgi:hypothetical protein
MFSHKQLVGVKCSVILGFLSSQAAIRNRIRELRRQTPRGRWRSRQRDRHSQTPRWRSKGSRLSSTKGRHSTCDGRSLACSSRRVVRGSVTGCDPQAPSTLWIVIIRQHRRNSMLHSASCLELVLLVTLRWYVIPSALGNHHNNQTRRNDRHNRHRGPAAPTASRPPRTLTQPDCCTRIRMRCWRHCSPAGLSRLRFRPPCRAALCMGPSASLWMRTGNRVVCGVMVNTSGGCRGTGRLPRYRLGPHGDGGRGRWSCGKPIPNRPGPHPSQRTRRGRGMGPSAGAGPFKISLVRCSADCLGTSSPNNAPAAAITSRCSPSRPSPRCPPRPEAQPTPAAPPSTSFQVVEAQHLLI